MHIPISPGCSDEICNEEMYNPNTNEITDFASFKVRCKTELALKNEDETDWRCVESKNCVYLLVMDEAADSVQNMEPGLLLPLSRHSIVIDEQLNVQIASKDEQVRVSLCEGAKLSSFSQLLTIMYLLTEPSYEEEYLDVEWEESGTSLLESADTPEALQQSDVVELEETSPEYSNRKFKCSYCPKRFVRPCKRSEHENVHLGRKPFVCKICGQGFSASSTCLAHSQLHNDVRNHACPVCEQKFHRKRNMVLHHKVVHLKQKPYTCPICQRSYTDRACHKRHVASHSSDSAKEASTSSIVTKPFLAEITHEPSKLAQNQNQTEEAEQTPPKTRRKRNTLPKRHACKLCGLMFARRRNVEYHVKYTHTGIKPYECELCGKKYSDITSFKRHIREHANIPMQQSATGEDICVPAQGVTMCQDTGENSVVTSYIILDSMNL